ncbi:COMPASS component Swd1p [Trichomonascus vanleenenianus]|uniref:COMPASS subunit protein SWD1 n=1 Tax=Trichomonascus vanleenenianus TaxID=2268995 RepID=UPI003EC96943
MNLALDPFLFSQEYPEKLTRNISYGSSVCVKFSPSGDYVASGLIDGSIVIFDFETLNAIKILRRHVAAIHSFSWSRDGRYLVSASKDWKCIMWDLSTGKELYSFNLQCPIWIAQLSPDSNSIAAALYESDPVLIDLSTPEPEIHTLVSDEPQDGKKRKTLSIAYSKSGEYVFCGTNRGVVNVFDTKTRELVHTAQICRAIIISVTLSPSGRRAVLNCSDRTIRLVELPDFSSPPSQWSFTVVQKFQDVVNRRSWSSTGMSVSEDYVGATVVNDHDLVLWETEMGTLQKIYEGPKEELLSLEFHPKRSIIAAVGAELGYIYLFEPVTTQRWSALAPDFVELEDNVQYAEREDEFDIYDNEDEKQQKQAEDEDVDILTPLDTDAPFIIPVTLDHMKD